MLSKEKKKFRKINTKELLQMLSEILLLLIFISPTILQPLKLFIIICCMLLIIMDSSIVSNPVSVKVFVWIGVFISLNFLFLFLGTSTNKDVLLQLFPSYVISPMLFFILFVIPSIKINLEKVITQALTIIVCLMFYTYLSYYIKLPLINYIQLIFPFSINDYAGFVGYFTPAITSLFFIVPYIVSFLFFQKVDVKKVFLLGLTIALLVLIGRRALLMIAALSIVFCILFDIFLLKSKRSFRNIIIISIFGIVALYLASIYFPDSRVFNIDSLLIEQGDMQRKLQFEALISGWEQKPIFGHGYGVNTESVVRSLTVPGIYELSYVALLFQTGVIGFLIYMYLYIWLNIKLLLICKKEKKVENVAFFLGLLSVFIANATNPYMQSFDGMWAIFFGLMLVNNDEKRILEAKEDVSNS